MAGLIPSRLSDLVTVKLSSVARWANSEREAAIAAIRATPAAKSPVVLVGTGDADSPYGRDGDGTYDNGPPSQGYEGVSIEGYERVMLYWEQSAANQQTAGTIFLMDADENWFRYGTLEFLANETRQIVDRPIVTEGFKQLYVQLHQPPDNSGGELLNYTNVYLFPHNEEMSNGY